MFRMARILNRPLASLLAPGMRVLTLPFSLDVIIVVGVRENKLRAIFGCEVNLTN